MNCKHRVIAAVAFATLVAVGRAAATTFSVDVAPGGEHSFSPMSVSIQQGDTVKWTWKGSGHTVTSGTPGNPSGLFDSGLHSSGFTFSFTFSDPGTFSYYCIPHGASGMTGTVIVAPNSTTMVTVGDGGFFFFPSSVTINPGDTVQWIWNGSGHSSTSGTPGQPSGFWDSGILNSGATFSYTFPDAGSFPYFCSPHGLCCGMVGSVTVTANDDIVLQAHVKAQGNKHQVQLQWRPADGGDINILRNGVVVATTPDDGQAPSNLGTHTGTFIYQVCGTDSGDCSNEVTVVVP